MLHTHLLFQFLDVKGFLIFRRFDEVMTEYNRIQVEYREQSKGKIARQMELAGKTATDEELEQMLEVTMSTTISIYLETDVTHPAQRQLLK